jgi:hypothetical protein
MPYDASNNPENYALYALSQYIMHRQGFYPAVPIMDFPNEASVITNENLQDGERLKYAYFDMMDVVERPEDMELEGAPLPSGTTSVFASPSTVIGLTALVITYFFALASFG